MYSPEGITTAITHKPFSMTKKYLWLFITLSIVVIFIGFILGRLSIASPSPTQTPQPVPTEKATINKTFSFPVKGSDGAPVATLAYTITDVAEQNEIILQGEKATAVSGRTFFIVNLKITNPSQQGIQINARDYVRLSTKGNNEQLAPDIHNDPVMVQAISTKYSRLGFPVNASDKKFVLSVGEINGSKTAIPVNFSSK